MVSRIRICFVVFGSVFVGKENELGEEVEFI
jgi:hypothetical protein